MGNNDPEQLKTTYINLMAQIDNNSINQLMNSIEGKIKEGTERFIILISSPGGSVFYGISAYNFLKGIPAEVFTHNYGSADSIATVIFCAGIKRFCVPNARFLIHGLGWNVPPGVRLEEKHLKEQVDSFKTDRENISKIISDNCNKTVAEIEKDMLEGVTLNAQQAKEYGLVDEVKTQLFEKGADLIGIRQLSKS